MRIGEIAEITGLSISNIRFYEKKGLIGPDREKENKYRTYTNADVERLKQIILYRKMDISVEIIGKIFNGEILPETALEEQMQELKEKQQTLQNSIDLCRKIMDDKAFENYDIDFYLHYVKEEEAQGRFFQSMDELMEDFSSFTQFDRFVGGSLLGWWLFPKPWMNRVAVVIWCLFFPAVPIIGIIDDVTDENGLSPIALLFWIAWMLFLGISFLHFRRARHHSNMQW